MIKKRIELVREFMKERGIDVLVVPTADYHGSEYIGEYFQARKYLSGFTGSAGTLVIAGDEAGLYTDGRYFIQAERQLSGTGIRLYRSGEPEVPAIDEYIYNLVPEGGCLSFDARLLNAKEGIRYEQMLQKKHASIQTEEELFDCIWKDRPRLSAEKAFYLEERYSGRSVCDKLTSLRNEMNELGATVHILTSLDDIAWLYNIRGNDIPHNPVVLSYSVITMESAILFTGTGVLGQDLENLLAYNGVQIREYNSIYDYVKTMSVQEHILLDMGKINYAVYNNIPQETVLIDRTNPTTLAKAVKNETEIANLKEAHIKDGVAFTKFMFWLKTNIGKSTMTELSAAEYLEELRRQQDGFLGLSFETISAYQENAAMMHYSASEESSKELLCEGLYLVDSGGQYYQGTTDITRTIALGPITEEQRLHFTTVLKSMLRLSKAKFLYGCRGVNLDILARGPLWDIGIDYKCGTGHGVGYLLNVHEAPNGFRWKIVPERNDSCIIEPGMVTTNEPGVYLEGRYGIRIENELLCVEQEENEWGRFLSFESITVAPIDLDAIAVNYLEESDRIALNEYHEMVFQKIGPYLSDAERSWLREYTAAI